MIILIRLLRRINYDHRSRRSSIVLRSFFPWLVPLRTICFVRSSSSSSFALIISQILVVAALRLAPVLGVMASGVAGTILGIVVLLLARQMPSMLGNAGARGGVGSLGLMLLMRRAVLRR